MAAEIIPIQSCCDSLIKYRITGTFGGWSGGLFPNVGDVCYISGDSNIPDNCYIRIPPVTPTPPSYLYDGTINPVTDCDDPLCEPCPQPITTTTTIPITTTTTTIYVPVPNVPLEPTNECDVITIFPMGVECFTINPTNTETFDGAASLVITGGTPPYEILWETGSVGTTITNLSVGEYTATVTDFYGDFLIQTTCELTAPFVPTTTTTSTTTLPQFGDLCMIVTGQGSKANQNKYIDFTFNGYYNGKPSWSAITENLFMYWNTGTTNQWLVSGGTSNTLYNSNPTSPPTSGWSFLGPTKALVSVVEGNCNSLPPIGMQISKNNATCINDGSIIINAYGGTPPYLYSITGGFTTQTSPVFQNLAGGTYNVTVIDSNNLFDTQNVTLTSTAVNTTYVVTLNTLTTNNNIKNFTISVSPTLPAGVTISYDLIYETEFKVSPTPTSANQVITSTINVNGSPITNPSPVLSPSTLPNLTNPSCPPFLITNRVFTWSNINMTTTTTVTGIISDIITAVTPQPPCYFGNKITSLTINNLAISGCECCSVLLQQTGGNATGFILSPIFTP